MGVKWCFSNKGDPFSGAARYLANLSAQVGFLVAVVAAAIVFTAPYGPAAGEMPTGAVVVTLLWTWNLYQLVGAQTAEGARAP